MPSAHMTISQQGHNHTTTTRYARRGIGKGFEWVNDFRSGQSALTYGIHDDIFHVDSLIFAGKAGQKTSPETLDPWLKLNNMLAPSTTQAGKPNLTTLWGAVRSDGKTLKKRRVRDNDYDLFMHARRHNTAITESNMVTASLNGVMIATELRTRLEVIDFDNCARELYSRTLHMLMQNHVVPLLAVESGSKNSMHLYVVAEADYERGDILGWLDELADAYLPNNVDMNAVAKLECKSISSIRLPGSASLKSRSWAKPVPMFSPFSRRYLSHQEATWQVSSILAFCGLSAKPEGPRIHDKQDHIEQPYMPISSTWDVVGAEKLSLGAKPEIATGGSLASGYGDTAANDTRISAALDAAAIARGNDTSQALLDGLNLLWGHGIRTPGDMLTAVTERFSTNRAFIKARRKGTRWTSLRVTEFINQRVAWITDALGEYTDGHHSSLHQVEEYRKHLATMRAWLQYRIDQKWEWAITWGMARIFLLRFADSWTGCDVPLSVRDVQLFCGIGSSTAQSLLRSLVNRGVIERSSEPDVRSVSTWTLIAQGYRWSEAYGTVNITPSRWMPQLRLSSGDEMASRPMADLWWHPGLLDEDGLSDYHPLVAGNDSSLWKALQVQMDTVRRRVYQDRLEWYRSPKERSIRLLSLVSEAPVIPLGSPRLHLSADDFGFWSVWIAGYADNVLLIEGVQMGAESELNSKDRAVLLVLKRMYGDGT